MGKLRALLINEDVLKKLKEYAENNPLGLDIIKKIATGVLPPIGDNPNHICQLFDGFRIAFSVEKASEEFWFRHASISVSDNYPNVIACNEIIKRLGFKNEIEEGVKIEGFIVYAEEKSRAVNIMEVIVPLSENK